MNLTRWQRPELASWAGFGRLSSLRDEIDRLFEAPLKEFARGSQLLSGWTPALDVFEDKDYLTVMMFACIPQDTPKTAPKTSSQEDGSMSFNSGTDNCRTVLFQSNRIINHKFLDRLYDSIQRMLRDGTTQSTCNSER